MSKQEEGCAPNIYIYIYIYLGFATAQSAMGSQNDIMTYAEFTLLQSVHPDTDTMGGEGGVSPIERAPSTEAATIIRPAQ